MGGRGSSSNSGTMAISSAKQYADKKTNEFIAKNGGSTSDGEIGGVYEEAFISEALRGGIAKEKINTELNGMNRTEGIDYTKGFERNAQRNVEFAVSQNKDLKASDFKSYRPNGWKVVENSTAAPRGYAWVSNGKSEQALVPKTTL